MATIEKLVNERREREGKNFQGKNLIKVKLLIKQTQLGISELYQLIFVSIKLAIQANSAYRVNSVISI